MGVANINHKLSDKFYEFLVPGEKLLWAERAYEGQFKNLLNYKYLAGVIIRVLICLSLLWLIYNEFISKGADDYIIYSLLAILVVCVTVVSRIFSTLASIRKYYAVSTSRLFVYSDFIWFGANIVSIHLRSFEKLNISTLNGKFSAINVEHRLSKDQNIYENYSFDFEGVKDVEQVKKMIEEALEKTRRDNE